MVKRNIYTILTYIKPPTQNKWKPPTQIITVPFKNEGVDIQRCRYGEEVQVQMCRYAREVMILVPYLSKIVDLNILDAQSADETA